ncbi:MULTISPECIES: HpcH/HpaI aldolase/citrate lyase family protein [Sphingobium]|uniref:HpcH/HpaI aldolase/citrate lyase family protein n=1 Tax=Sphingobium TaxID=165695 RepID=UPI00159C41A4|nr:MULTISPECIES: CoA ester lyase [unclassified Sphingobium]
MRPFRSVLYLPGNKERVLEKAASLPCDVLIIDLEDAVAPDAKDAARDLAIHAIRNIDYGDRLAMLRVNGPETPWHEADMAAAGHAPAILLPKVSDAGMLAAARARLGPGKPLWAMIETCQAILRMDSIAGAADETGLEGLVVGTNDLAKELRCQVDDNRTALQSALFTVVAAARAYGLVAVDGVCNRLKDEDFLAAECRQGAMLGFDGKSLIHPEQIDVANRIFSPAEADIVHARAVVEAFEDPANAGKGVLTVNGKMAELLHLEEARRIIAVKARIDALAA